MTTKIFASKKHLTLSFLVLLPFLLLTRCQNLDNTNERVSDTTAVLQMLLDSALLNNRLPNSAELKKPYPFGDTIIFKYDTLLNKHLPVNLKYKLLTESELCSLTTIYRHTPNGFHYFLELKNFQKSDTSYHAALELHCLYGDSTISECEYQKYCNGGIGMTVKKRARKLEAEAPMFWDY